MKHGNLAQGKAFGYCELLSSSQTSTLKRTNALNVFNYVIVCSGPNEVSF